MKTQQAIDHFGSRGALAKALGIDKTAINHWGDKVPELRQFQIQVISDNKLLADRPPVEMTGAV